MAGQEDVFQPGEARHHDIRHHAERHDQRGGGAVFLQRDGDNGFVIRNDALNIERVFEHAAQRIERSDQYRGAAAQKR